MTNCPNCGAVITKDRCEYCGTLFMDVVRIKKFSELISLCVGEFNVTAYVTNIQVRRNLNANISIDSAGEKHYSVNPKLDITLELKEV